MPDTLLATDELATFQAAVTLAELRAPIATLRQLADTLDRARKTAEPRVAAQAARDVAKWADSLAASLRLVGMRLEDAGESYVAAVTTDLFDLA